MERFIRIGLRSLADSPLSQDPVHFRPAERAARGCRGPRRGERPDPAERRGEPTWSTPPSPRPAGACSYRWRPPARSRSPISTAFPSPAAPGRGTSASSLRPVHGRGARELCAGGRRGTHTRVGVSLLNAKGATVRRFSIPARGQTAEPAKLVLALAPGRAGLRPHRYRWRVAREPRRVPALQGQPAGGRHPPLPPAPGPGRRLHRRRRRPRHQRPARPRRRRPHLRRRPQLLHRRLRRRPPRKARRRDLLRDRPGDRRPRGDDAAPPPRGQRDRQPHDPPSGLPRLRRPEGDERPDRGRHPLPALPLPAPRRRRERRRDRAPAPRRG